MCSVQECSMGPWASETKTAQSVALSPQCYHIRTSLAGKFLIYAVIFSCPPPSSFCCHCWYWQGFHIQMPVAHSLYTHSVYTTIYHVFTPVELTKELKSIMQRRRCSFKSRMVKCVKPLRAMSLYALNAQCIPANVRVCVLADVKLRPAPLLQPVAATEDDFSFFPPNAECLRKYLNIPRVFCTCSPACKGSFNLCPRRDPESVKT